jgi:hypothetical protein
MEELRDLYCPFCSVRVEWARTGETKNTYRILVMNIVGNIHFENLKGTVSATKYTCECNCRNVYGMKSIGK